MWFQIAKLVQKTRVAVTCVPCVNAIIYQPQVAATNVSRVKVLLGLLEVLSLVLPPPFAYFSHDTA